MKHGHFAILFCILFAGCFLILFMEQKNYDKALEEKKQVEQGLTDAVEYTAMKLAEVLYDSVEKKQQVIEQEFMNSLYISFGTLEDVVERERLKLHIPLVALAEADGICFCYVEEVMREGRTELQQVWTEKKPFSVEEVMTESRKKAMVAEMIESYASDIITNHNYIAEQYGLNYRFSVPRFLQNTSDVLEFPMLFVVFQGWPLQTAGNLVYENCVDVGGYLKEVEYYVLELPTDLTGTFSYYHKADCDILSTRGGVVSNFVVTKEEAVRNYGAFSCDFCIP